MKRLIIVLGILSVMLSAGFAQQKKMGTIRNGVTGKLSTYPEVTVTQLQFVPQINLLRLDTLQNTNSDSAKLQWSPYYHSPHVAGDTVIIVAHVTVPPHVITYTACGYTMVIADTGSTYHPWGGILVRLPNRGNDPLSDANGFANIEQGDIIRMAGAVTEFPVGAGVNNFNSVSQFEPLDSTVFEILQSSVPLPPPLPMNLSTFIDLAGNNRYSTGEQWEGLPVVTTNVIIDGYVFFTRGTFQFVDQNGYRLSDLDDSKWFTLRDIDPSSTCDHKDPSSTYTLPPLGTTIDTIRGIVLATSGGENYRAYRINPMFPGDIVLGNVLPALSTHRRTPIFVTDSARISVKATIGTYSLDSLAPITMYYRQNFGAYTPVIMALDTTDTLYKATIPTKPAGTLVNYWFKALDRNGGTAKLANANSNVQSDTSKGTFFYKVLSGSPTIYDVQYTPFLNGYSAYIGAKTNLTGTITADTAHLAKVSISSWGTSCWYIQTGNAPWNGIWVEAPESLMHGRVNGDSILVRGTIGENTVLQNGAITEIFNVDSVHLIASGRPIPDPITLPASIFAAAPQNLTPVAEPYEGMLVRLTNTTVSALNPYFPDPTEYSVDDGTGSVIVLRDGFTSYSNQAGDTASGKLVFDVGEKIDTIVGVMFNSSNAWKIDPRTNADMVTGRRYSYSNRWNMISVPRTVPDYRKTIIYPNPTATSPAYAYQSGYSVKDTLKNGVGYWLKFSGNQTIRYNGVAITEDTVSVVPGWNMIGSITDSVATSSIVQIPASNVNSQYYSYNNGYSASTQIQGGRGYWVKVNNAGKLVLSGGGFAFAKEDRSEIENLQALNSITITDKNQNTQTLYFGSTKDDKLQVDKYLMPPSPPAGGFDARYTSQRMAELYPSDLKSEQEYSIKMSAPSYPITVTWSIVDHDANKTYTVSPATSDKNKKAQQLIATGSMTINNAKNDILVLTIGNKDVPKEFALGRNYPNPFNPTTRFTIAVPQTAKVELIVYDILGRKVKTLFNEEKSAGYHTIEWNGLSDANTSVATGVYFVRMSSEKFTAVRKMMMMK